MKPRVREEKDATARCPFCRELLTFPETIETETGGFIGGRCPCGAVFACDPTGHNVGEAYLDALTHACGEDWGLFYSLGAGDDYEEAVFNYDLRTHRLWAVRDARRDYAGKIIFVRIKRNR